MNVPGPPEPGQALVNFEDQPSVVRPARPDLGKQKRQREARDSVALTVSSVLHWARHQRWATKAGQNDYRVLQALCRIALRRHDDTFLMTSRELALEADLTDHEAVLTSGEHLRAHGVVGFWATVIEDRNLTTTWQITAPAAGVCSGPPCSRVVVDLEEVDLSLLSQIRREDGSLSHGGSEHTLLRPACYSPGAWRDYQGMGALGLLIHQAGSEGRLREDGHHTMVTVADCVHLFQYERSAAHRTLTRLDKRGFARRGSSSPGSPTTYLFRLGSVVEDRDYLRCGNPLNAAERAHELQAEYYAWESEEYEMQRTLGFPGTTSREDIKRFVASLQTNNATEALARLAATGGTAALVKAVSEIPGRRDAAVPGQPALLRGASHIHTPRFAKPDRPSLAERRHPQTVPTLVIADSIADVDVTTETDSRASPLPGLARLRDRLSATGLEPINEVEVTTRIRREVVADKS